MSSTDKRVALHGEAHRAASAPGSHDEFELTQGVSTFTLFEFFCGRKGPRRSRSDARNRPGTAVPGTRVESSLRGRVTPSLARRRQRHGSASRLSRGLRRGTEAAALPKARPGRDDGSRGGTIPTALSDKGTAAARNWTRWTPSRASETAVAGAVVAYRCRYAGSEVRSDGCGFSHGSYSAGAGHEARWLKLRSASAQHVLLLRAHGLDENKPACCAK